MTASAANLPRIINMVMASGFLTALLVIGLAVLTIPSINQGRDAAVAVDEQADVLGCRALARTEIDEASGRLDVARTDLEAITSEQLDALIRNDDERLQVLTELAAETRIRLGVLSAELDAATEGYRAAIDLSSEEPDAFLIACLGGTG